MFAKLNRDLNAILARDPAAGSKLAAMFLYPSFQVMLAYRIANPLWRVKFRFPARFIMQLARLFTGIEIHPGATIGCGFFVDHGSGVVIGETSIIGRNVTLYQGVTLGGVLPAVDPQAQRCTKRHPTLEDDVIVGSGAQIWVTLGLARVPSGWQFGGHARCSGRGHRGWRAGPSACRQGEAGGRGRSFAAYGVSHLDEVDPRARTIEALVAEVQTLRARLNDMEDRLSPTPLHDDAGKAAITDKDDLTLPPRKS